MSSDDAQLLENYCQSGCHRAFEDLVHRYLPLVTQAARRITRSDAAARDIAQQVFTNLATKPRAVPSKIPLVAWLHRTTRSLAINHVRGEERRRRREAEAATSLQMHRNDESHDWKAIAPVIDAALDALKDEDRSAILLRFYEGASHRTIGQRLGVKEDTARVRVARALTKLQNHLEKRQVSVRSTTALTASLAVGFSSSSTPAHGASAVAQQALPSIKTSTVLTPAWLLLGISVFVASSSVSYWVSRQRSPDVIGTSTLQDHPTLSVLPEHRHPRVALRPEELVQPIDKRLQLAVDLWNAKAYDDHRRVMDSFTPNESLAALELLDHDHRYNATLHRLMSRILVTTLAHHDSEAIANEAIQRVHEDSFSWKRGNRLHTILDIWGNVDHQAAGSWLKRQSIPHSMRMSLTESLARTASATDPAFAMSLLLEIPYLERQESYGMFQSMSSPELREVTLDCLAAVEEEMDRASIFAGSILRHIDTHDAMVEAFSQMNFSRGDTVVPLLDKIVEQAEIGTNDFASALGFAWEHAPEEARDHFLDRHVAKWNRQSPEAAVTWLGKHDLTRDDLQRAVDSFRTQR